MVKAKTIIKAKKKWYQVTATKLFNENPIGEILVSDVHDLVGRSVSVNLMNLTGDIKHQNANVKFRISQIADGKPRTQLASYELSPPLIRRLIRRGINRLDDSFVCETSDNQYIRIKSLLLTRHKTTSSALKALRSTLRTKLVKEVKKSPVDEIVKDLITQKLQNSIKKSLKKIYPLKTLEIKKLELVKKEEAKKAETLPEAEEKEVEKTEKVGSNAEAKD